MPDRRRRRAIVARTGVIGLVAIIGVGAAGAHILISPAQSKLGKKETYTLTVPTEGTSPTSSVELDVPQNVTIISVSAPANEYALIKEGERITHVRWSVNIPPGGGKELTFIAQNPSGPPSRIGWSVHQIFADGSKADWVDPPPAHPAPSTRLLAN